MSQIKDIIINIQELNKFDGNIYEYLILKSINDCTPDIIDLILVNAPYTKEEIFDKLELEQKIKVVDEQVFLLKKAKDIFKGNKKKDAIEVINYLNEKCNKKFGLTDANLKFVISRFLEGYSIDDCKVAIDNMYHLWHNDTKMKIYLRPETLFNATKFQTYINLTSEDNEWTKNIV